MKKYLFVVGIMAVGLWLVSFLMVGEVDAQEEPAEVEKVEEEQELAGEEQKPAQGKKKEKKKKKVKKDVMYHLDPFIVNLARSQGNRFLKITVSLEISSPEVRSNLEKNVQKISDSIILLLSTKTFEDVYSVQGKFTLKGEITTRVNQFLTVGQVKGAYFTEFLIQ